MPDGSNAEKFEKERAKGAPVRLKLGFGIDGIHHYCVDSRGRMVSGRCTKYAGMNS